MPKRKCGSIDASLGRNLAYFRRLAGMTQQQVADELNLNRTTYTKYETGVSEPGIEMLKRIAEILNVDVASLVADEDTENAADPIDDAFAGLEPELRNLLTDYNGLSRDDREEVYRLIRHLNS